MTRLVGEGQNGIALAVLDNGRYIWVGGNGRWYAANPAMNGIERDGMLVEVERIVGPR